MLNSQPANVQEQIAQLEHTQQTTLGVLNAFDQLRAQYPGYVLDICTGEYERVAQQFEQTRAQLDEVKRKVVVSPASRAAVPRLIQMFLSR